MRTIRSSQGASTHEVDQFCLPIGLPPILRANYSNDMNRHKIYLVPIFLLSLTLFVLGCQGQAESNAQAINSGDYTWLGVRPEKTMAAKYYDEARKCLQDGNRDQNSIMKIGQLAFSEDTIPALVAIMENGNIIQKRGAWVGLRALVEGVACSGFVDFGEYEETKKRIMPLLPTYHDRIAKALKELPPPSQRAYQKTVELIAAWKN